MGESQNLLLCIHEFSTAPLGPPVTKPQVPKVIVRGRGLRVPGVSFYGWDCAGTRRGKKSECEGIPATQLKPSSPRHWQHSTRRRQHIPGISQRTREAGYLQLPSTCGVLVDHFRAFHGPRSGRQVGSRVEKNSRV